MLHLVCTSIPYLSSRWNWKKTVGSTWVCFGVRVPGKIGLSKRKCTVWSQCTPAPDRRTDGWTDKQTDRRTNGRTSWKHLWFTCD